MSRGACRFLMEPVKSLPALLSVMRPVPALKEEAPVTVKAVDCVMSPLPEAALMAPPTVPPPRLSDQARPPTPMPPPARWAATNG